MLIFVAISLANINLMNVAYGKKTIADVDQPVLPPWGGACRSRKTQPQELSSPVRTTNRLWEPLSE